MPLVGQVRQAVDCALLHSEHDEWHELHVPWVPTTSTNDLQAQGRERKRLMSHGLDIDMGMVELGESSKRRRDVPSR